MPLLPFINDTEENVRSLIEQAAANGAKYVYFSSAVTLRDNQREYFYQQLDKKFPSLREKYEKTFGNKYVCYSPNSNQLSKLARTEYKKHGLLYSMPDIIRAYKYEHPTRKEQLKLF